MHSCLRKQWISYAVFCLKKKTLSLHGPPFHESTNIEQHRSSANIRADPSCYFEHRKNISDPADLGRKTHTVTRFAIFLTPRPSVDNTSDAINIYNVCEETTFSDRQHRRPAPTRSYKKGIRSFSTVASIPHVIKQTSTILQNRINNQERAPEVSSTRRLQYLS